MVIYFKGAELFLTFQISAQCTAKPSFGVDDSELAPLECRRSVCQCPSGYSHSNGQCRSILLSRRIKTAKFRSDVYCWTTW